MTKRTLRTNVRKAVAAIAKHDAANRGLWRNVQTFSSCFTNPYHEQAQSAHEEMEELRLQLERAVEAAWLEGVRPSTLARLCEGYVKRFNLSVYCQTIKGCG